VSRLQSPEYVQPSSPEVHVAIVTAVGHVAWQSAEHVAAVSPQSQRPLPHALAPQAAQLPAVVHQLLVPPQESGLTVHVQPVVAPPHVGVVPEHAAQDGPHELVVVHATQVFPLHVAPAPHEVASHVHAVPSHDGVVPLQTMQLAPQCAAV